MAPISSSVLKLSPFVTGAILFALTLGPAGIREPLSARLSSASSSSVSTIITALLALLSLSVIANAHVLLEGWAERNWKWSADDRAAWVWSREVAVVTGGSNGIGAAIAQRLAGKGVNVAVFDVLPLGPQVSGSAGASRIHFFKVDLRKREDVAKAADEVRSRLGVPSILVNNAGIGNAGSILDADPVKLRAIFDINIIAHWFTIQEFLPDMLKRKKGHIMSVSSMSAFTGVGGISDYCAIKSGLYALHESLNQELKHLYKAPEILTSIAFPLWTRTRLTADIESDIKRSKVPIMDASDVGSTIADQILNVRRGRLYLPNKIWTRAAAGLRGHPLWIQELIRDRTVVTETGSTHELGAGESAKEKISRSVK